MIELENLRAGYAGHVVLEDLSLSFPPGKILVLVGPNGCGKSTLLRTVLGLQPKLGGSIRYDGRPMEELSPRLRAQQAAYLAQSRSVPNITAWRMVLHGRFPHLSYPRRYRAEDYQVVKQALRQVGAEEIADLPLPSLSGGQQQNIYLAMALAQQTQTVLMDEPTTYLDIRHQLEVMRLARTLADQGRAVVLVLHDLCLALRTADEVAVLERGRLIRRGPPEAVCGVLEQVFGITLHQVETEAGPRYYYD